MIKLLSLFSGIGAPEKALKNLGIAYDLVGYSENGETAQKLEPNMDGVSNTLTTVQKDNLVIEPKCTMTQDMRIRKLTPKECWRLMGFADADIDRCINAGISNTQLYKQAGNSIVVNVLEKIFKNILTILDR